MADIVLNPLSDATPAGIADTVGDPGTGVEPSRDDHVHAHASRGGGSLHALVVAAGAAGFMSGADKSKLDGVASGASATYLGLTDTAGAFVVGNFPQTTPAGTALAQFDLFGTANAWTATQTLQDIAFDAQETRKVGTPTAQAAAIYGAQLHAVKHGGTGLGTVTFPDTGVTAGFTYTAGGGAASLIRAFGYGGFGPGILGGLSVARVAGSSSHVEASGPGANVLGTAYASTAHHAEVKADSFGAFATGFAWAYGAGAEILSYGSGAIAAGYVIGFGGGTGTIKARGAGSFAQGATGQSATKSILAWGHGSFAQGFCQGTINTSHLYAKGNGSMVQGFTLADAAGDAVLTTTANGAFAQGSASGYSKILAEGLGAFPQLP